MKRTQLALLAISILLTSQAAYAGDTGSIEIPTQLPNPFKPQEVTKAAPIGDDLKELEQALYGEANLDKPDDLRISALERTVFGVSGAFENQAMRTRVDNLKKIVSYVSDGRKWFSDGKWQEAKSNFEEALKLADKKWKSLLKAEIYYRLGMCDYEMSNVRQAKAAGVKTSGKLLLSSRDSLTKAQEYYNAYKQYETAQKIGTFLNSFKDKAETYFLY